MSELFGIPYTNIIALARQGLVNLIVEDESKKSWSIGAAIVPAEVSTVTKEVENIRLQDGGFIKTVPMVEKFEFLGYHEGKARIKITLRYRFFIVKFRFHIIAEAVTDQRSNLDIDGISGNISDLHIRFRVVPVSDTSSLFVCAIRYDVSSLSWIVDYFLKHHPEIELGIFSSTSIVIAQTLRNRMMELSHGLKS